MEPIYVHMLGDFTLKYGNSVISDNQNRTKKVWMLLAYLICNKNKIITRKELIHLLWGNDATSSNPENALKITFHRVRALLDQLSPDLGHKMVKWQDNGYIWSDEIPTILDIDCFSSMCHSKPESESTAANYYLEALALYQGYFLANLPEEDWITPFRTHYHGLFLESVITTIPQISSYGQHEEAVQILKKAIFYEPYYEYLHQLLMQEYMALGNQAAALAVYDNLNQRLLSDFSKSPGNDIYEVYRAIMQQQTESALSIDYVLDSLFEKDSSAGALKCDYDYFKILCHSEARISARTGNSSHIVLISVTGKGKKILSKEKLELSMAQVGETIRLNLRRGDAYTQCSSSQFIIMLREANFDNSCMVSRRIVNSFQKEYPRSNVQLLYKAELLTPSTIIS